MGNVKELLAKNVRAKRVEMGLTQLGLAEAIGCSMQTIQRLESGNQFPRQDIIEAIAQYFKVDENYLFSGSSVSEFRAGQSVAAQPSKSKKSVGELSVEELAEALSAYALGAEKVLKPPQSEKEKLLARITSALSAFDEDKLTVIAESYERRVANGSVKMRRSKMGS